MQLAEEAEMKNTFELACLLFKEQFSKENLEKYIKYKTGDGSLFGTIYFIPLILLKL